MERLTREESFGLLDICQVAHIGLIAHGSPYVTPMSFVRIDDRILFRTEAGKKLDALRADPRVCVEASVFDESTGEWASVIIDGKAREVTENRDKQTAVNGLIDKYSAVLGDPLGRGGLQPLPGFPHVIEVAIEEISGMSSGRGFSARTKPGRL